MKLPHITPSATLGSLVLLLTLLHTPGTDAANARYAVVTQGAFLLSEETVLRDGRHFHSLVGYLPIGTTVAIEDQKTTIYSTKTDRSDTYLVARSELGLTGLLRGDLFVEFDDRPIVVPIGLEQVRLYRDAYAQDEKPTECDGKKCIFFSRNDDVHLEITDESHESYYGVTLYRHRQVRDYPMQEKGWISRRRIDRGWKKINPTDAPINMASWRSETPKEETLQQKIVDKVGDRFDNLGQLLCQTSAAVEADAGVRVLGSGVVFKVDAKLKEQGMFRLLEGYVVDSGDKELHYRLSRDIVCEDSSPVRMSRLILEEITPTNGDPINSDQILLKDLEDTNSQWILSLQGKDTYTKMIAVDSWETYNAVHKKLEDMAEVGTGYLSELDATEQQITLNFLIQQIAIFQHRKRAFEADQ